MKHRLGFTDQNLMRYSRFISRAAAGASNIHMPVEIRRLANFAEWIAWGVMGSPHLPDFRSASSPSPAREKVNAFR